MRADLIQSIITLEEFAGWEGDRVGLFCLGPLHGLRR